MTKKQSTSRVIYFIVGPTFIERPVQVGEALHKLQGFALTRHVCDDAVSTLKATYYHVFNAQHSRIEYLRIEVVYRTLT